MMIDLQRDILEEFANLQSLNEKSLYWDNNSIQIWNNRNSYHRKWCALNPAKMKEYRKRYNIWRRMKKVTDPVWHEKQKAKRREYDRKKRALKNV